MQRYTNEKRVLIVKTYYKTEESIVILVLIMSRVSVVERLGTWPYWKLILNYFIQQLDDNELYNSRCAENVRLCFTVLTRI